MANRRNSTIEVLRIAAMVGIVAHHYAVHGGVMDVTFDRDAAVFLSVLSAFGKWGVNLFVLVGAFFMVGQPRRGRALAGIYSQVLPLSWLILAFMAVTDTVILSMADVKTAALPVIFGQYWFVTAYVMLVLIAPYLAMLAERLSQVQLQRLVVVGVLLWSGLTMVDGVRLAISDLGWFVLLFMIAAYIRLHGVPGSARAWFIATVATGVALATAVALMTSIRWSMTGLPEDLAWPRELLSGQYSPLALAFAVCALVAAVKRPVGHSRMVNYWAGASFGVYLIHDNPLVRRWLWTEFADTPRAAAHDWLPLHAIAVVLAVYIASSLIIFALRPVVLTPALRLATAVRKRIEARLESDPPEPEPKNSSRIP